MRITNSMMGDMFLSDANKSLNRVLKYQNQVDSTKRVSNISDDPQATMLALRARNRLSGIETYQGNITTVKSHLIEAESAADGLNELLQST
jgi:flagellar hook-associated protein 3 FlgL